MTGTKEYEFWSAVRGRCEDPNDVSYQWYGAKGIRMYEEWANDIHTFLRDIGPKPSSVHSLDRINNEGHYEPGNVKWSTPREQAQNKSTNVYVTINNETLCVAEWCRKLGVATRMVASRIHRGWKHEDAIMLPITDSDLIRNKGPMKRNKTGFKGVSLISGKHPKKKPYVAQIMYLGKQIRIGSFATKEEAALAYNEKAKELIGESAYLNVIDTILAEAA